MAERVGSGMARRNRSAFFLREPLRMTTRVSAALLIAALAACKGDGEAAERAPAARSQPAPPPPPATVPEPEALDILRAVDSSRIAAGFLVRERSESAPVLEFARVMRADHRAINALLGSLVSTRGAPATPHPLALELRTAGTDFVARLAAVDTGFNNGYLRQEIADHERLLQVIDTLLLNSAKDTAVKATFERLRPAYQAHLQYAREILRARETAAARRAAAPVAPRPQIDTAVQIMTTTTNQ